VDDKELTNACVWNYTPVEIQSANNFGTRMFRLTRLTRLSFTLSIPRTWRRRVTTITSLHLVYRRWTCDWR